MSVYNTQEIMEILPHRHPFLLIDTIEELQPGVRAVGRKNVTFNEPYFAGHFPGNPVVPGVVLCEIMAQTTSVLLAEKAKGCTPYFTGLDHVKFREKVRPGDTLMIESRILKNKGPFYFAEGKGSVNGKICVSAEFSFALIAQESGQ